MTIKEKYNNCKAFFEALSDMLSDQYEILESINKVDSACLCPIGTTGEVTYYSKPEKSFRVAKYWNWYANTERCSDREYIQCYSPDLPRTFRRMNGDKAGKPVTAASVCFYRDGVYHVVYGERWDKKTRRWTWVDNTPGEVCQKLGIEL